MTEAWWEQVREEDLRQGDLLPGCLVPIMAETATELPAGQVEGISFDVHVFDLIVLTQSCDLENNKAPLVAACPYFSVSEYETLNPEAARKGRWELVRQGRLEGLHLLGSTVAVEDNRQALVVDFHQIYSLPITYLKRRAGELGPRFRLRSPYLEHFSQSFARFFMRVGLPAAIPPYR